MKHSSLKYIAFGLFTLSPLSQAANQEATMRFTTEIAATCGVALATAGVKPILFKGEAAESGNSHTLEFLANKDVTVDFTVAPVRQLVKSLDDSALTDNLTLNLKSNTINESKVIGPANNPDTKAELTNLKFSENLEVALTAPTTEKHHVKEGSYEYTVTATVSCTG